MSNILQGRLARNAAQRIGDFGCLHRIVDWDLTIAAVSFKLLFLPTGNPSRDRPITPLVRYYVRLYPIFESRAQSISYYDLGNTESA